MTEPFEIRIAQTQDLTGAQRDEIVRMCNAAFDTDQFNGLFGFLNQGGRHFVGYTDGRAVSHAVVTTRWLQLENGAMLRTGFVDAVATLPEAQGKGYNSALMGKLAESVADYDIACLETSIVGYYTRLGWEEWRGSLAGRSENGLIPTPDQRGVMILKLPRTPALDLDSLLTIEDQGIRIW